MPAGHHASPYAESSQRFQQRIRSSSPSQAGAPHRPPALGPAARAAFPRLHLQVPRGSPRGEPVAAPPPTATGGPPAGSSCLQSTGAGAAPGHGAARLAAAASTEVVQPSGAGRFSAPPQSGAQAAQPRGYPGTQGRRGSAADVGASEKAATRETASGPAESEEAAASKCTTAAGDEGALSRAGKGGGGGGGLAGLMEQGSLSCGPAMLQLWQLHQTSTAKAGGASGSGATVLSNGLMPRQGSRLGATSVATAKSVRRLCREDQRRLQHSPSLPQGSSCTAQLQGCEAGQGLAQGLLSCLAAGPEAEHTHRTRPSSAAAPARPPSVRPGSTGTLTGAAAGLAGLSEARQPGSEAGEPGGVGNFPAPLGFPSQF